VKQVRHISACAASLLVLEAAKINAGLASNSIFACCSILLRNCHALSSESVATGRLVATLYKNKYIIHFNKLQLNLRRRAYLQVMIRQAGSESVSIYKGRQIGHYQRSAGHLFPANYAIEFVVARLTSKRCG